MSILNPAMMKRLYQWVREQEKKVKYAEITLNFIVHQGEIVKFEKWVKEKEQAIKD